MPGPTPLPQRLLNRLDELAAVLRTDPAALGLLALGSVGADARRLDAWSDLDFFVIVEREAKARYIADLGWLQRAHATAWSFQNTVDGHKALMTDGVFCEFAVFAPDELSRVPYAPGRWVWRRETLEASLAQPAVPLPGRHAAMWLVGEALGNLIVGLLRHARGERLSALRLVQVHALDRVLELAALDGDDPATLAPADPFSPERRIEARHPTLAAALPAWAGGYEQTVPAARALLAWLRAQHEVPEAVAAHIEALADASEHGPKTPG